MTWWMWVLLAAAAGYGLHRCALWAEGRGWIYYREKRMPSGAAGLAMMHVAQIFEPEIAHVIEEITSEAARGGMTDPTGQGSPPGDDTGKATQVTAPNT